MLHDPNTQRQLARQRERELIEEANRERLARVVRDQGRASDTKRHGARPTAPRSGGRLDHGHEFPSHPLSRLVSCWWERGPDRWEPAEC
jgi:hypothetical protein